jgi:hypothetical protein
MPFLAILLFLSQDFTQRGFVQSQATVYPQAAVNDSGRTIGDFQVRYESFYKPWTNLQIAASIDVRTDTHHQTERDFRFDWKDRSRQRPLFSLRRFSAQYHRQNLTVEAGKQFVRWGRTDIVNPTDRFAPRDFLTVVDNEFLGINAVRATYERNDDTLDVLWAPELTPSRTPLFSQRWFLPPPIAIPLAVERDIPKESQAGIRWSHTGFVEFAAAFYSGFNHLPSYELVPGAAAIRETYAKQRMFGGDVGVPFQVLSIKGEAAWFQSPDHRNDDYLLYVIQLERQAGEWFFVGGYGGQRVTKTGMQSGDFNPDRGMTRTILARAGYTIDVNRSIAFESAVRENLDGFWSKLEYSQALGQHWRLTTALTAIRGKPSDFLGQYRKNSHVAVIARYSF